MAEPRQSFSVLLLRIVEGRASLIVMSVEVFVFVCCASIFGLSWQIDGTVGNGFFSDGALLVCGSVEEVALGGDGTDGTLRVRGSIDGTVDLGGPVTLRVRGSMGGEFTIVCSSCCVADIDRQRRQLRGLSCFRGSQRIMQAMDISDGRLYIADLFERDNGRTFHTHLRSKNLPSVI